MNYMKIVPCDIANGPSVRVSIFVSGCNHRCTGCHNPQTWNENAGHPFTKETLDELVKLLKPDYIQGLTLTGGDPLYEYNRECILAICKMVREAYGNTKDIWLWTGYRWEEIRSVFAVQYLDVLVDGEYVNSLRNIALPYAGSTNQRVIDVKQSIVKNKIVLYKQKEIK